MSETKELKLFKHEEPLESNENEFDIDKALNQNWDRIKEYVEQLNTDINSLQEENTKSKEEITNIKEEQETQNANIEENENKIVELQKENVELKEENSRLKEDLNAFPIVKASGEYVTLDTADSRFKELKICGNSKQESRSGKNILNINDKNSSLINANKTINANSITVTSTGTTATTSRMEIPVDYEIDTDYTVKFHYKYVNGFDSKYNSTVYMRKASSQIISNHVSLNNKEDDGIFKFNLSEKEASLWLYIKSVTIEGTVSIEFSDIQIVKGNYTLDTFPEYEQYGVMPSSDYISEIENVGSNINIFNKNGNSKTNGVSITVLETGVRVTATTAGSWKYSGIELGRSELLGKTITISSKMVAKTLTRRCINLFFGNGNNMAITNIGSLNKSGSETLAIPTDFPQGCDRITAILYVADSGSVNVGDYVDYTDLKIEIGNKATSYSEYGFKSVRIGFDGKNKLNNNRDNYHIESYQTYEFGRLGKDYTLSLIDNDKSVDISGLYILLFNNDAYGNSTVKENIVSNGNILKTKHTGKNINNFGIYPSSEEAFNKIFTRFKIQIEENTKATNYEEYKIPRTILFPLSAGQKLYKRSYLAEDGTHHKRKQIVLDGTEMFTLRGNKEGIYTYSCDLIKDYLHADNLRCLISHFKFLGTVDTVSKALNGVEGFMFYYKEGSMESSQYLNTNIATVEKLKKYLAEQYLNKTPVTIEYELAEEEVEAYTEEQAEAYKQIQNARSYEGQTNIFGLGGTSPIFEVTARRNLNTLFTGGDT